MFSALFYNITANFFFKFYTFRNANGNIKWMWYFYNIIFLPKWRHTNTNWKWVMLGQHMWFSIPMIKYFSVFKYINDYELKDWICITWHFQFWKAFFLIKVDSLFFFSSFRFHLFNFFFKWLTYGISVIEYTWVCWNFICDSIRYVVNEK